MSKTNHKLKEFVGAAISRPNFEGISEKEKGITLIALIITIVVMLILVAVTLDISIGENGLVNKAKTASEATTKAMEQEMLLTAAIGAMGNDGTVNFTVLNSNLPEGFTGSNGNYTSKNGNTFTVAENGEVVYIENNQSGGENPGNNGESSADLELLRTYFLGEIDDTTGERPGKKLEDLFEDATILEYIEENVGGDLDLSQIKFKSNEIIKNADSTLITISLGFHERDEYTTMPFYIEYNNNNYIVYTDAGNYTTKAVQILTTTSSVDLNGTYYSWSDGSNFVIEDYRTMTFNYEDQNSDTFNFVNVYFDDIGKTIALAMENGMMFDGNYKLIYDNGNLVNILITFGNTCNNYQNLNGLDTTLEGAYLSENQDRRLVFNSSEGTVNQEYLSYNQEWTPDSEGSSKYFVYDGKIFMNGSICAIIVNSNEINYYGTIYTKQ